MRRCNIPPPSCRHPYSTPCCQDCEEQDCPMRCQNDPKRCKCWADKPPRQKRERKISGLVVVYLHEKGMTQTEIASYLRCSRSTVGNILRKLEVTKDG